MPADSAVTIILAQNYRPMKKWTQRNHSGGSNGKLIKDIRKILGIILGNRVAAMLKTV